MDYHKAKTFGLSKGILSTQHKTIGYNIQFKFRRSKEKTWISELS